MDVLQVWTGGVRRALNHLGGLGVLTVTAIWAEMITLATLCLTSYTEAYSLFYVWLLLAGSENVHKVNRWHWWRSLAIDIGSELSIARGEREGRKRGEDCLAPRTDSLSPRFNSIWPRGQPRGGQTHADTNTKYASCFLPCNVDWRLAVYQHKICRRSQFISEKILGTRAETTLTLTAASEK